MSRASFEAQNKVLNSKLEDAQDKITSYRRAIGALSLFAVGLFVLEIYPK
jgi:hypothetical protein